MSELRPYVDLIAPYLLATAVAACTLLAAGKPMPLKQALGKIGRSGFVGGAFAPIFAALSASVPLPESVAAAVAKLEISATQIKSAWAAALGGGYIKAPDIRAAFLRLLGAK